MLQVTSWDGYIAKWGWSRQGRMGRTCGRHGKITEMQTGFWLGQLSRYGNSLWDGRFGDRIPVGEARFFRTRPDRPWGLTSLPHNGFRVFSGVKRPRRGAEVKESVKLYLYYPSRPSWPVLRWTLPLPLPLPLPLTERPLGRHRRARETKRHLGGCELHPSGSG